MKKISKTTVTVSIIWFLLGVFFLITVAGQIYIYINKPLKTEVALMYDTTESVLFKGIYLRNETQIEYNTNGVISYTHKDGSKMAINSTVAKIYNSEDDIFIQERIAELEEQIKALTDAQSFVGTDNSQLEAFAGHLSDKHAQILRCIDDGDYEKASELKNDYLNLQSKLNIIKGTQSGYGWKISALQDEMATLKLNISGVSENLEIPEPGYFVSSADGYENLLSYDNYGDLSSEDIENVVKNPELDVPRGVIGKIIDGYKWRMAAVLDTEKTKSVFEGSSVVLRLGALQSEVEVSIKSVKRLDNGKSVYIFECDRLSGEFAKKRVTSARLLLSDYSGIRIPQSAVRFNNEGERGVFITNGSSIEFRKINAVLTAEDYIIVENTGLDGYIKLYDNVVVSGKDLYDGKIIS